MESSDRDMYRQFQDWCLRTYGDSGKTKTVTRKKYDRIVQLLNGSESSSTDNAKFKFWVKSKGFQLGNSDEVSGGAGGGKQVLYVPVKTTVSRELSSLFYVGRCSPLREREAQGEPQPQLAPSSPLPPSHHHHVAFACHIIHRRGLCGSFLFKAIVRTTHPAGSVSFSSSSSLSPRPLRPFPLPRAAAAGFGVGHCPAAAAAAAAAPAIVAGPGGPG